jgi:hypothetical protein
MIICIGAALVRPLGLQCLGHPERSQGRFTISFQLPRPVNERYYPDGRYSFKYTNFVPRAWCEKYEQSYVLENWSERPGRDRRQTEVLNESRKAIDCQAMPGARTSNLVCCFGIVLLL